MITKGKINWELLAKKMAGETRDGENAELDAWLEMNSANRALFEEIKTDWKKMDQMERQFNVDRAWNKLHHRIAEREDLPVTAAGAVIARRTWLSPLRHRSLCSAMREHASPRAAMLHHHIL